MRLAEIDKKIETTENKLDSLRAARAEARGRTFVRCTNSVLGKGCGRRSKISTIVYIQTHWYEQPYGCTGGALWHQSEGQFVCLKCGNRNRLYDRPEIEELSRYFKSIENIYKDKSWL